MKKTVKCHQKKISRLLLMLTLLVGIFTFSGFSSAARSVIDQKAVQTEAHISTARKADVKAISFAGALRLSKHHQASGFQLSWKMALISFDNLMQVKLAGISSKPRFRCPVQCCHFTKMPPQGSSEEEPFSA
jgi:hypothetical protein